jgi:hypothetical protein
LNREAAAIASLAFENRETTKVYLAVLEGHLRYEDFPAIEKSDVFDSNEGDEDTLAVKKNEPRTVVLSNAWQTEAMEAMLTTCLQHLRAWASIATQNSADPDWQKLFAISFEEYTGSSKLRKQLRKFLKVKGYVIDEVPCQNTSSYSDSTNVGMVRVAEPRATVNCGKQVIDTNHAYYDKSANRLIIKFPIAEIENDFRMEIGHQGNPGKHCFTSVEIIERTFCVVRSL